MLLDNLLQTNRNFKYMPAEIFSITKPNRVNFESKRSRITFQKLGGRSDLITSVCTAEFLL